MEKTLKLDGATALRLYKTASPEFKELLEQNFTKEFFSQKITDKISDYADVMELSGTTKSDDIVNVKGFNDEENKVVSAFIKKIRIVKIYNEGWLPKRGDRRWYPYWNVSSGFVFINSLFDGAIASTASASRLSLKSEELCQDYRKKFQQIEEDLIDLK